MADFEYEERYRVDDPAAAQRLLEAAGFVVTGRQEQIDHWFVPNRISSSDEQAHWFDHEGGYALRIRGETTDTSRHTFVTVKQTLRGEDHSALSNFETELSTNGLLQVFELIGAEFSDAATQLRARADSGAITVPEAAQFITSAGRKEYLAIHKLRTTFAHPQRPTPQSPARIGHSLLGEVLTIPSKTL